jgi:Uma2 family endonuclease
MGLGWSIAVGGIIMPASATAPALTPKLMTADEFWEFTQLPANSEKHFELVRGEVIELPPPTKPHCRVCMNAGFELETYARRTQNGYAVGNDSGVILERDPDTVRGPDVSYFLEADSFRGMDQKYSESIPVLVVEVQSPGDRQLKLTRKIAAYLESGVKVVWVVNFEGRFASIHRRDKAPEVFECGQRIALPELPGFSCFVDDLFRMPKDFATGS